MPKSKQEYTSAKTCVRQVPALMKMGIWTYGDIGNINLDYGGGKYDDAGEYLHDNFQITNLVYDPFNRSAEHNAFIRWLLDKYKADSATCCNVLNVIKEKEVRLQVLRDISKLTKPGRKVLISCYRGRGNRPRKTCNGWQNNKPIEWYLPEVKKVFPKAFVWKGVIVGFNEF
jgi:hypothetical protein